MVRSASSSFQPVAFLTAGHRKLKLWSKKNINFSTHLIVVIKSKKPKSKKLWLLENTGETIPSLFCFGAKPRFSQGPSRVSAPTLLANFSIDHMSPPAPNTSPPPHRRRRRPPLQAAPRRRRRRIGNWRRTSGGSRRRGVPSRSSTPTTWAPTAGRLPAPWGASRGARAVPPPLIVPFAFGVNGADLRTLAAE